MNKEQTVKHEDARKSLIRWLSVAMQLAVLCIVAILLLWPASVTPNELPAGNSGSDLMFSSWPTALLIQRTFAQLHRLPFWNPYYGGGQPLAGDPLAALFYPPTFLVPFLSLRRYYLLLLLGHLIFAGLGTLLLARYVVKLPRLPALVAAVSFMATPRLLSHLGAGHVTIVQTVSWFPWLALACWATVQAPRRWGLLLGICIAMTLLAGHPQMAYYGLLMTAGLAVWLLWKRWRQEGRQAVIKPIIGLAVAAVIGALLAAIQLVPVLELTSLSTRQLSVSSADAFPFLDFLHAVIDPTPVGGIPWEGMMSPGQVVLVLALLGVATRWRRAWPLALGVVLIAGLAMGNASLFYLIVAHILPELDLFRGLARIWFVALLPIALLAGLGTEALLDGVRRITSRAQRFSSFAMIAVGVLAVLVVAYTLLLTDSGYARSADIRVATTPTTLASEAAQLAGSGRIYGVQENILQVSAVQLQAPLADGWNPLLIESYVAFMQHAGGYVVQGYQLHIPSYDDSTVHPNARLLGLMHVTVVVSTRGLTDPNFVKVAYANGTIIYKNLADAGPGYLVAVGPHGLPPLFNQMQIIPTDVQLITQTPEQETFTFSSQTEAYFVVAMPIFPGWNAVVDGHAVPVSRIGGAFPAIKVGPGRHTLSYSYTPYSVYYGAILSAIGLLAALLWFSSGYFYSRGKFRWPRKDRKTRGGSTSDSDDTGTDTGISDITEERPAQINAELNSNVQ